MHTHTTHALTVHLSFHVVLLLFHCRMWWLLLTDSYCFQNMIHFSCIFSNCVCTATVCIIFGVFEFSVVAALAAIVNTAQWALVQFSPSLLQRWWKYGSSEWVDLRKEKDMAMPKLEEWKCSNYRSESELRAALLHYKHAKNKMKCKWWKTVVTACFLQTVLALSVC